MRAPPGPLSGEASSWSGLNSKVGQGESKPRRAEREEGGKMGRRGGEE